MELKEEHKKAVTFTITNKFKLIGRYLDEDIFEYVELEDGRAFVYESIAIQHIPGVYSVNEVDSNYIIVYPNLLYREIVK